MEKVIGGDMNESKDFPGFFEIPGHSQYLISRSGVVFNLTTGRVRKPIPTGVGYFGYTLRDDAGNVKVWTRHRLMMFIFRNPGAEFSRLVVNHLNGIKGDDRLENLEWTTQQRNLEHAGSLGLNPHCRPCSVRDTASGKVTDFPSMTACAIELGISKDAVLYRCRYGEGRVFSDGYQYRCGSGENGWYIPDEIERRIGMMAPFKPVLVRDVDTGVIRCMTSLKELSVMTGLGTAALSTRLNASCHPIICSKYQIKWLSDTRPWRIIADLDAERTSFKGSRRVSVTDTHTGEETIFNSLRECAMARKLKSTTLFERLRAGGSKVWKDGFVYRYHDSQWSPQVEMPVETSL